MLYARRSIPITGVLFFVAVGSLHLTGKRGLVELLRAKGYLVRQH